MQTEKSIANYTYLAANEQKLVGFMTRLTGQVPVLVSEFYLYSKVNNA